MIPAHFNAYSYGFNNPITFPDPTGMSPTPGWSVPGCSWSSAGGYNGCANHKDGSAKGSKATSLTGTASAKSNGYGDSNLTPIDLLRYTHPDLPNPTCNTKACAAYNLGLLGLHGWAHPEQAGKDGRYGYVKKYVIQQPPNKKNGREIFTILMDNLSSQFPPFALEGGSVDNPEIDQEILLSFGNKVTVSGVGERFLTLVSQEGHLEGAGNIITFSVDPTGTYFHVVADGPTVGGRLAAVIPDLSWPLYASRRYTSTDHL